jgi:hypothetical protein
VKQGDLICPLLFGDLISSLLGDRMENWVAEQLSGAGVGMGQKMLQMLLYADDLPLLVCATSTSYKACCEYYMTNMLAVANFSDAYDLE